MAASKRLTIINIANQLNISTTTVSFIINDKAKEKGISEALTKKVLKYVKEKGYKPHALAKSLRTGKTNLIGLLIEDISNPFFSGIAKLIEEKAYAKGYKIIYCSTENDTKKAQEIISVFREKHVDGYIIVPSPGLENDLTELVNDNIPVVLFDRHFSKLKMDAVIIDNLESAYEGVKHLINNGFKHIAMMVTDSKQSTMVHRLQGYQKAIREAGLREYIKKIPFVTIDGKNKAAMMAQFLKAHPKTDAVFFATNYLGIYGLEAFKSLNITVKKDIGMLTFDDHDLFRLTTPTISAINQPVEQLAVKLIDRLLEKLDTDAKPTPSQTYILPAELIIRESSMA